MSSVQLNCKGLNCPMPIVRISQAIKKMDPGESLVVEATDPAFPADLRAWAGRMGHEIVSVDAGDCIRATLKKGERTCR